MTVEAPAAPALSRAESAQFQELVSMVKQRQRASRLARVQWHTFCDDHGEGMRNPAYHSAEFLAKFLQVPAPPSRSGARSPAGGSSELARGAPARLDHGAAQAPAGVEAQGAQEQAPSAAPASSALAAWLRLPPPWRPLFAAPARLRYDASRFDFVGVVRRILECPPEVPLGRLHEVQRDPDFEPVPPLRTGMVLAGVRMPKRTHHKTHKDRRGWLTSAAYQELCDLYGRFLREEVLPTLGAAACGLLDMEYVVQSAPVLRVIMPSEHCATKEHRDADYGHIPEELNFWLPLTPVWDSNSLYAESWPGQGDFEPFEGDVGDLFRWWGNQCSHYARPNSTGSTRVTLDFRVIPRQFWDAAQTSGAVSRMQKEQKLWHDGELDIGSYYCLARGASQEARGPAAAAGSRGAAGGVEDPHDGELDVGSHLCLARGAPREARGPAAEGGRGGSSAAQSVRGAPAAAPESHAGHTGRACRWRARLLRWCACGVSSR